MGISKGGIDAKEEYLKYVKGIKTTRFGTNVLGVKEFYYPTKTQIAKFKKYGIPYDIDPAMRDVIIKLHECGYVTYTSCQGHTKGGKGWITVNPHESEIHKKYTNGLEIKFSKKRVNPINVKKIITSCGIVVNGYKKPNPPESITHLFEINGIDGFKYM